MTINEVRDMQAIATQSIAQCLIMFEQVCGVEVEDVVITRRRKCGENGTERTVEFNLKLKVCL